MEKEIILVISCMLIMCSGRCFETDSSKAWDAFDEACFYARHHHFRTDKLPVEQQVSLHTALNQLYYENGMRRPDTDIMQLCSKYFQPMCLPTVAELQEQVCYYAAHGKFKGIIAPELAPYYYNALNAFYDNLRKSLTYYLAMSKYLSVTGISKNIKTKEHSEGIVPIDNIGVIIKSSELGENVTIDQPLRETLINESNIKKLEDTVNYDSITLLIAAILNKDKVPINDGKNGIIAVNIDLRNNTVTNSIVSESLLNRNTLTQNTSAAVSSESDLDENNESQNNNTSEIIESKYVSLANLDSHNETTTQFIGIGTVDAPPAESVAEESASHSKLPSKNESDLKNIGSAKQDNETAQINQIKESDKSGSNLDDNFTSQNDTSSNVMETTYVIHSYTTAHKNDSRLHTDLESQNNTLEMTEGRNTHHKTQNLHNYPTAGGVESRSASHKNLDSQNNSSPPNSGGEDTHHRSKTSHNHTAESVESRSASHTKLDSQNKSSPKNPGGENTHHKSKTSHIHAAAESVESRSASHTNLGSQNNSSPQNSGGENTHHKSKTSHIHAAAESVESRSASHTNLDSQNNSSPKNSGGENTHHISKTPHNHAAAESVESRSASHTNLDSQNNSSPKKSGGEDTHHISKTSHNHAAAESGKSRSASHTNLNSQNNSSPQNSVEDNTHHESKTSHNHASANSVESGSESQRELDSRNTSAQEMTRGNTHYNTSQNKTAPLAEGEKNKHHKFQTSHDHPAAKGVQTRPASNENLNSQNETDLKHIESRSAEQHNEMTQVDQVEESDKSGSVSDAGFTSQNNTSSDVKETTYVIQKYTTIRNDTASQMTESNDTHHEIKT